MSITRERLTPEESRASALEAARALLIESGPQAVTLKAVGARIGKTHGNLLHHFGSAAGLQGELARLIGERVTAEIARVVERERQGEADPREIVDRTFDAFDREGAGALAAWMILSGNRDALNPIRDAKERKMITGAHVMLFSRDPEADREFLRDVLEISCIDSGGGWLIFRLPP